MILFPSIHPSLLSLLPERLQEDRASASMLGSRNPMRKTFPVCCASTSDHGARNREHRAKRMIFFVIAVLPAFRSLTSDRMIICRFGQKSSLARACLKVSPTFRAEAHGHSFHCQHGSPRFFCCCFFARITKGHGIRKKLAHIYANDLEKRIDYESNFEQLREVMSFGKAFSVVHKKKL